MGISCSFAFVFDTGRLFALFLSFPCLEINLMPDNGVLNMSAEFLFPAVVLAASVFSKGFFLENLKLWGTVTDEFEEHLNSGVS